jgi:hypothetical protein
VRVDKQAFCELVKVKFAEFMDQKKELAPPTGGEHQRQRACIGGEGAAKSGKNRKKPERARKNEKRIAKHMDTAKQRNVLNRGSFG